jgi:hypothetical protein
MKTLITGPRSGLTDERELPWMHIELELEELPKRGDVIILNSGGSYYVKNIMWWVDGPENDAYWNRTQDYEVEGQYQVVHIDVEPDNRREHYGYPAGLEDGKKQGGETFLAELRSMVGLAKSAGGLDLVDAWLSKHEQALAERKAAEEQAELRAAEMLIAASKAAAERRGGHDR